MHQAGPIAEGRDDGTSSRCITERLSCRVKGLTAISDVLLLDQPQPDVAVSRRHDTRAGCGNMVEADAWRIPAIPNLPYRNISKRRW